LTRDGKKPLPFLESKVRRLREIVLNRYVALASRSRSNPQKLKTLSSRYDKATGIVPSIQVIRQEQDTSILSNETATETNISAGFNSVQASGNFGLTDSLN